MLRYLGLAIAALAFAVPATAAFAADPTPSAVPAPLGSPASGGPAAHGGLPGVTVAHGMLRLIGSPGADTAAATEPLRIASGDGPPVVVLRSSVSHVSAFSVPGISTSVAAGSATPPWVAGAVPAGADLSTTGSRAPPAER